MNSELQRELFGTDSDDEDEGEEEPYVPPNGPPDSTWVHEALEVPEGLWVPNRWLPLYREVENSETWLHSKYMKAFDALRAASRPREAALTKANDANDAVRAAERALEAAKRKAREAHNVFTRLDAEHNLQRDRKNTAHDHWYNYLVAARDWTDSLTQPGARATKATERVEVEVDDEESAERRVPTPWEEEEEDLFGDNDEPDNYVAPRQEWHHGMGERRRTNDPNNPTRRPGRQVVEPVSSEEEANPQFDDSSDDERPPPRRPPPRRPPPRPKPKPKVVNDNDSSDGERLALRRRANDPNDPAVQAKRQKPKPKVVNDNDSSDDDDDDVVMVGQRTWKQRDDEARRKAVDLTSPRATNSCVAEVFRKIGL